MRGGRGSKHQVKYISSAEPMESVKESNNKLRLKVRDGNAELTIVGVSLKSNHFLLASMMVEL